MSQDVFSNTRKPRITSLSLQLFRPLARLWLRHGFTAYEVQELLRWSMTRAAMHDPEFAVPGRDVHRQTMARAAVLTGLPRREVQRLFDCDSPDLDMLERKYHRVSRLLAGWQKDAEFHDEAGKPRDLPMRSEIENSFTDLAYRYCRDVPARAMADELVSRGNVQRLPGRRLRLIDPAAHVVRGTGEEIAVLDAVGGALMNTLCDALEGRPVQHAYAHSIPSHRKQELQDEMQDMLGEFVAEAMELLKRFEAVQGVREEVAESYGLAALLLHGDRCRKVLN